MESLTEALLEGAPGEHPRTLDLPGDYLAARLGAEEVGMFGGAEDKDVRKPLHVGAVPMPELAPDEVVFVMASSVDHNTVWSATFEPVPTFAFLERFGRTDGFAARHDLPYHVVGSDASGVVVRAGAGVRRWRPGDRVVVSCVQIDGQEPATHDDAMLGAGQRIRDAGGIPVGVVGSEPMDELLRGLGCDVVINRDEIGLGDDRVGTPEQTVKSGKRLGRAIRARVGRTRTSCSTSSAGRPAASRCSWSARAASWSPAAPARDTSTNSATVVCG
ncbi:alcohol dehydrogenase catalytic domain-containing protein [Streptomyces sp.]|uniref:alcohol dehydrogenase catalytic domain-containing protein n=1 Tax=Streptomyces sp. TaxID=1931 RepID=UPI002F42CC07